jgi:Anthrone oxygenase
VPAAPQRERYAVHPDPRDLPPDRPHPGRQPDRVRTDGDSIQFKPANPGCSTSSPRSHAVGAENLVHSVDLRPRILNGWFFGSCFGALLLTAVAAVLHLRADGRPVLPWIADVLVLYVVAPVITIGVNVPLNNQLTAAGDPDRIADLACSARALRRDLGAVEPRPRGGPTARWVPHLAHVLYRRTVTPGRA